MAEIIDSLQNETSTSPSPTVVPETNQNKTNKNLFLILIFIIILLSITSIFLAYNLLKVNHQLNSSSPAQLALESNLSSSPKPDSDIVSQSNPPLLTNDQLLLELDALDSDTIAKRIVPQNSLPDLDPQLIGFDLNDSLLADHGDNYQWKLYTNPQLGLSVALVVGEDGITIKQTDNAICFSNGATDCYLIIPKDPNLTTKATIDQIFFSQLTPAQQANCQVVAANPEYYPNNNAYLINVNSDLTEEENEQIWMDSMSEKGQPCGPFGAIWESASMFFTDPSVNDRFAYYISLGHLSHTFPGTFFQLSAPSAN